MSCRTNRWRRTAAPLFRAPKTLSEFLTLFENLVAKRSHAATMLDFPKAGDQVMTDRLIQRKEQAGLSHRSEITTFIDFIDADEGRI